MWGGSADLVCALSVEHVVLCWGPGHSEATEVPESLSPECGNGVVEPGEECDDNNLADGDGCSETCEVGVTSVAFDFTGAIETWEVPSGVTQITVKSWGAGGGTNPAPHNATGGGGGYAEATLTVDACQALAIVVGEAGTTTPCLLYTSPSPRDATLSRMPSSA